MATPTIVHKTTSSSGTDTNLYTSASISVDAGDTLWAVHVSGSISGTTESPLLPAGTLGSTLTWHDDGMTVLMNTSFRGRITVFWANCPSTASGTVTLRFDTNQSSGHWHLFTTQGNDQTNPVRNFDVDQITGSNPSVTLSPAPLSDSLVVAVMIANATTAAAAAGGYTLLATPPASQSSPALRMAVEYDDTSPATTPSFTHSGSTNKAIIAFEIVGAAPPAGTEGEVVVGGVKKAIANEWVIIGGVKKAVVNKSVIIGGAKKPVV